MTQAADDGSMERAPFRDSPGQPRSHSATSRWKGADAPAAALTPRSSPRARYPWMETTKFQDAPAPTPAILAPTLLSVDGRAWMPPQLPHPTVLARDSPVMLAPDALPSLERSAEPLTTRGRAEVAIEVAIEVACDIKDILQGAVFIPINIRETHWYLAVIHAINMEIQVIDSLGTSQDRKDLTDSIKGLQRQIDMISQRKELKDHRWPDLQVASWPLREIDMGYAKQTDSSSCGLFLLNYIEYWTGDELSDSFTQDDMSHFRKKMAAILLSSDLNKRRGCLLYKNDKEVDSGSPSDVEILENSIDSKKRKLLHVLHDSEVVYEDEEGPITQADLQKWFVDDWDKRAPVKVSNDGCTNDFLMVGLSTKDMPVTKADSIDVLCDYIMAIEDDMTLEMTWVRSFNPFKIEISVKDLQNILTINQDMILRCFDMAVRLLANKESRRPKGEIINNRKHYMDMRFWRMVGFGKLPKYHQDPTAEELAKTLDCWPSMNYYITGCRYVLMPWKFNGCYALFVIDHVKKHVTFIDFTPTQDWCKHMPYKRFAEAIIMASKKYKIAYNKKRSGWAEDIFKWEHTIQTGVPIDLRGFNTSYLVLQAMSMWGNDRQMKFVGDAKIVRRNFVIDLLSYEDNSCRYAIPANIQQRLIDIAKKD
uniref:Ubiquitin-like protease family profile domain-containing protein n=1 Tax=Zea mays TaxID=4577 RepID=A0A804Q0Y5_MAIZE